MGSSTVSGISVRRTSDRRLLNDGDEQTIRTAKLRLFYEYIVPEKWISCEGVVLEDCVNLVVRTNRNSSREKTLKSISSVRIGNHHSSP